MPSSAQARRFYRAAKQRFDDALLLLEMERTTAAVYLAGYSVECMLKALILSAVSRGQEMETLGMFRGARAHDYEWLLHLYTEKGGAKDTAACGATFYPCQLMVHGHAVYTWHDRSAGGTRLRGCCRGNHHLGRWAVVIMARIDRSDKPDTQVQQVLDILTAYERAHPQAQIEGRRHNPVSIRLRIIDPDFEGMDRLEREPSIWKLLHRLPEEVLVNITMLLLLTPEEADTSLASQEFDHPIPSRL